MTFPVPEDVETSVVETSVEVIPSLVPPGLVERLVAQLRTFLGLRGPEPARAPRPAARHAATLPARPIARPPVPADPSLERGVRDIRRTDPGFDPERFVGYAAMVFRAAQRAWTARDLAPVRDRLTPELHDALQARCDRVRHSRRINRIEHVEITATVTEAWQESARDYLTAHISGSRVDYTVEEDRERVVDGSSTMPTAVEEFWTFTRPAGLNFWMLSAIQT